MLVILKNLKPSTLSIDIESLLMVTIKKVLSDIQWLVNDKIKCKVINNQI